MMEEDEKGDNHDRGISLTSSTKCPPEAPLTEESLSTNSSTHSGDSGIENVQDTSDYDIIYSHASLYRQSPKILQAFRSLSGQYITACGGASGQYITPGKDGFNTLRITRLSSINDLEKRKSGLLARTVGLLILLLGSFIISVGMAVLVYYLLLCESVRMTLSVSLLNKTYTPDVARSSSREFQNIQTSLCNDLRMMSLRDARIQFIISCSIANARAVPNPVTCKCPGFQRYGHGHVLGLDVVLELPHELPPNDLIQILRDHSNRKLVLGFHLVYIGDHIVDIDTGAYTDECFHSSCQNGGTCKTSKNGEATCECPDGWDGKWCENDVNSCARYPCLNKGVCHERMGVDTCLCKKGWTGKRCEIDLDECRYTPCQIGGLCLNTPGSYTCLCQNGWYGKLCRDDIDECVISPCRHDGTCTNSMGSYSCACDTGWTGLNCEEDENECVSEPCQNNGICMNTIGSYRCDCMEGWTGSDCRTDINECLLYPCHEDSTCLNFQGSFRCLCPPGFSGILCNHDKDECEFDPCHYNGTCLNKMGSYACSCIEGRTGSTCLQDVDECVYEPCHETGTCVNTPGSYTCRCQTGFTGKSCDVDINECEASPCLHGATCLNNVSSFTCTCKEGWTGELCGQDVDECRLSPCFNYSTCINTPGSYQCQCPNGWHGKHCEKDRDECLTLPCLHNGTCLNTIGLYTCKCEDGWDGEQCQLDFDECTANPCSQHGTCHNTPGAFYCDCSSGWTDTKCSTDIDECIASPCLNNGTCENYPGDFDCLCVKGWTGGKCEYDVNECLASPCQHSSRCNNNPGSYHCECEEGYMGKHCDIDVNECLVTPCSNNATCVNTIGSYSCKCSDSWTGDICDNDIDECSMHSCLHNSTCVNIPGSYVCECAVGWTGQNCDNGKNINECDLSPCKNNGRCINSVGSYTCNCNDEWSGSLCEEAIDRCQSSPCRHNSTCTNMMESYHCECNQGWTGKTCDIDLVSTNLTFNIINIPWDNSLASLKSSLSRTYSENFCHNISKILGSRFSSFSSCRVIRYYNEPVRLTVALNTAERYPEEALMEVIFNNTPSFFYLNKVVNVIGDIIVQSGHIIHDAWLTNITMNIYKFSYQSLFADNSSKEFKTFEKEFCADINSYFHNTSQSHRYYGCYLDHIGLTDPYSLSFVLILNGSTPISREAILDIISTKAPHVDLDNYDLMLIGNQFFYLHPSFNSIAINISDYTTPTPAPIDHKTVMNITFILQNLTYTPAMADSTSRAFLDISNPFCSHISSMIAIKPVFKSIYEHCKVTKIRREKDRNMITFLLQFQGIHDDKLQENIYGSLIENAPRTVVDGIISIIIGPLAIADTSLSLHNVSSSLITASTIDNETLSKERAEGRIEEMTLASVNVNDSKNILKQSSVENVTFDKMNMSHSQKTTEAPMNTTSDPCKPDKNNIFLALQADCHMFIRCIYGQSYQFPCAGYTVFYPDRNVCDYNNGTIQC